MSALNPSDVKVALSGLKEILKIGAHKRGFSNARGTDNRHWCPHEGTLLRQLVVEPLQFGFSSDEDWRSWREKWTRFHIEGSVLDYSAVTSWSAFASRGTIQRIFLRSILNPTY